MFTGLLGKFLLSHALGGLAMLVLEVCRGRQGQRLLRLMFLLELLGVALQVHQCSETNGLKLDDLGMHRLVLVEP